MLLPAVDLAVHRLACRRGQRLLFDDLSFTLAPGQVLWVRGANGRGKTSLLRLLTGLSSPDAGEIQWGGIGLRAAGPAYRAQLLYIGHANGLKDDLTVLEALQFLARIHGRPSSTEALGEALRRLAMYSRRAALVRTLSQGQRRRVALARLALDLAAPDGAALWVLDEPYDALDADGIVILNGLLSAQARRGGSVALTSHLPIGLVDPEPTVLQLDAAGSASDARVA
jgi:heme exporter protein A